MSVLSLSHLCIKAVGSRYFVIQSLTVTRMISSFVFLRVYFAIKISHYGSAEIQVLHLQLHFPKFRDV